MTLFQTPPSGYGGPGVLDELVYSGAGSGCRDDDEDACVLPDAGSGDDLITPVYVPSTRRPPSRLHKVIIFLYMYSKKHCKNFKYMFSWSDDYVVGRCEWQTDETL